MRSLVAISMLASLVACGGDGGGGDGDGGVIDAPPGARPHPLYPALDLDTLPGSGGGAIGPYQPPTLPTTTRSVAITTVGPRPRATWRRPAPPPAPRSPSPTAPVASAPSIWATVDDCDLSLGAAVVIDLLYLGHLPGPTRAPSHRIRVRGGQLGAVVVDPQSTRSGPRRRGHQQRRRAAGAARERGDLPDRRPGARRRLRRAVRGDQLDHPHGRDRARRRRQPRRLRLPGRRRPRRVLRQQQHRHRRQPQLMGLPPERRRQRALRRQHRAGVVPQDDPHERRPVDYVYVKGGTWMREATLTAGGLAINDSWAQLGDLGTDHVYLHDPTVWLASSEPVVFGASPGPGQAGKRWEARRIAWHARSAAVVSDAHLQGLADTCAASATCDYGFGTHRYTYDPALTLPTTAWRDLPTIALDDPDQQPIAP
jgi:hypothetical protein